jgi:hypothetical protein
MSHAFFLTCGILIYKKEKKKQMKVERGLSGGRMFSKREGGQESVMGCI